MGTRKKGSELVFNIQWRSKPDEADEKSNIIGMYDTPATTLNFATFKSYLLKNSGVVEKDVKVVYLTDNGAQWVIDSQEWFEIALCAFRLKARLGEIIFLKLETIPGANMHHQVARKHSNDVETQFDHHSIGNGLESPPEWFLAYMKQFKRDVVEEVTYAVSSNVVANPKEKESTPPVVVFPKKIKAESSKRSRKHMVLGEAPIDKEVLKTLKYDRKIESKLDKLDAKTKKIKEKKQALINKIDSEEYRKRPQILVNFDSTPLMNASVAESSVIPHMIGGETYLHTWEIKNNGKLPWTSKTELRLTWGSADLKPSVSSIRCPPLQPGEKGTLAVRFQVPKKPGQFESYWNFFDRDVRFGHGLSCVIIVDGPISHLGENLSWKKPKIEEEHQQNVFPEKCAVNTPEEPKVLQEDNVIVIQDSDESEVEAAAAAVSSSVMDLSRRMQDVKIVEVPHVDSDSDWESLGSYGRLRRTKTAEENLVMDDFDPLTSNKYGINEKDLIVDLSKSKKEATPPPSSVPEDKVETAKEEAKKQEENLISNDDNNNNGSSVNNNSSGESICEIASEASDLSSGYDVINGPAADEKEDNSGYVYITIDGNKLPVPKYILRPDFLENAEEAPGPLNSEDDEKTARLNSSEKEKSPEEQPAVDSVKTEQSEQILHYTKSFMDMMQTMNHSYDAFADANPGQRARVFVFPQDSPGFEFLYYPKGLDSTKGDTGPCPRFEKISLIESERPEDATDDKPQYECVFSPSKEPSSPADESPPKSSSETNPFAKNVGIAEKMYDAESAPVDPTHAYSWTQSQTQYTFPDIQSANTAHLRCDLYPPSDRSAGAERFRHVPNYQQSVPKSNCRPFKQTPPQHSTPNHSPVQPSAPVHILPENLVNGAVNVASSAINTARSVISMIVPPKAEAGKWVNGHWVTENPESARAKNLRLLADMGFWDVDLNATLLARYNDDISRVVSELLQ